MADALSDEDLAEIEGRLRAASAAGPPPWTAMLETRQPIGGCSFIQVGSAADQDDEIYLDLRVGGEHMLSPDVRLDAILDFVAHSVEDVRRLVTELRRMRDRG